MRVFFLTVFVLAYIGATRAGPGAAKDSRSSSASSDDAIVEDADFWMENGVKGIHEALEVAKRVNERVAKNVIVFIGDGMSAPTVTAARIYKAQQLNGNFETPESEHLVLESLEHMGLSKTYCIDYSTPDSASSGTALFTGVKARMGSLGFDESIDPDDILSTFNATKLPTVFDWAQGAGKRTGLVTTTRVTHATPGALYSHVHNRDWECDTALGEDVEIPENLHDVAWQLVNDAPGNKANVILGGGLPAFVHKNNLDHSNWTTCQGREDEDLLEKWLINHEKSQFVANENDLLDVDPDKVDYLLGLFSDEHMSYDDEHVPGEEPSLANMTQKAVEILSKGHNGFFLMVEAGRIDHAHHASTATRALQETIALDLAVEKTLDYLEEIGELDDTLVIVTSDHSHTMSISGYASRGRDIRGLSTWPYDDNLPYTMLSYANGPGWEKHNLVNENGDDVIRRDLTNDETVKDFDFVQTSSGPLRAETHGGDDTLIFAQGPMAHLFHTVHEETHVAHVMAYSACIGHFEGKDKRCMDHKNENDGDAGTINSPHIFLGILASIMLLLIQ